MIEKYIQMGEKGYTNILPIYSEKDWITLQSEARKRGYSTSGNELRFGNVVLRRAMR